MNTIWRIVCIAHMLILPCTQGVLSAEAYGLKDKEDDELLVALKEGDVMKRFTAIRLLSMRYEIPGRLVIHGKGPAQATYPMSKVISRELMDGVMLSAMSDPEVDVRTVAVMTMESIVDRTNVVTNFRNLLKSQDLNSRMRVVQKLCELAKSNRYHLKDQDAPVLAEALQKCADVAALERLLDCAGQLRPLPAELVTEIGRLTAHRSRGVRAKARKLVADMKN